MKRMIALKEWAIVCKALEDGKQILLLRKGGIMEFRKGFEIKHNEFFLYPTYEHQSKSSIKDEYIPYLESLLYDRHDNEKKYDSNKNSINLFAQVYEIIEITDRAILPKLQNYHIWNNEYVTMRINYNPTKPLNILLLRIFKIKEPLRVDIKDEWAGCKSWLNIDVDKKWENFELTDYLNRGLRDKSNIIGNDRDDNNKKTLIEPVLNDYRFNEIAKGIKEAVSNK